MNATTDLPSLPRLLRDLNPTLDPGTYLHVSVPSAHALRGEQPLASIREQEGLSVILSSQQAANLGLSDGTAMAWLTLKVNLELEAIGLTAIVASTLASEGIHCNVIAGYHHDHLFVGHHDGRRALAMLQSLSQGRD